jgi:adsorption protein B
MEALTLLLAATAFELGLFAACVFALFGIDDLAVDSLYLTGVADPVRAAPHPATPLQHDFALFIPAWSESRVIGSMLDHCLTAWPSSRLTVYVGVYANDLATMQAVASRVLHDRRVRMVVNDRPGPTTKGDCLNTLWRRHQQDRVMGRVGQGAILLHDAEDVVDPAALPLLDQALVTADYVQLPVIPLMGQGHHWIRRHYCDEFAEAHGKELAIRSALGAPMPTAGVGCAFRVDILERLAGPAGPFPADSLTEDYELGLRLGASGAQGDFVRAVAADGRTVASRGYFPERIDAAVRQKTRWLRGNALEGWRRIGWAQPPGASLARTIVSCWMLWRDRRALLAAVAIFAAYAAMLIGLLALALGAATGTIVSHGGPLAWLLASFNLMLLLWRLAMRGWFTSRVYGWPQGVMALLRQPVSNIILVMTAWRALLGHWRGLGGQPLVWDKTTHHFPDRPSGIIAATRR